MFSPLAFWEWKWAVRRTRPVGVRVALGTLLLVEMLLVAWLLSRKQASGIPPSLLVDGWIALLVLQHFLIVLLLTPAFFAGALADEKENGTLPLLLTTHLAPWQITLGKLIGRGWQVLLLACLDLPLFCIASHFVSLSSWATLWRLLLATAALVFFLSAWSLWVSLRARQARSAAVLMYLVLGSAGVGLWLLSRFIMPWLAQQFAETPNLRPWVNFLAEVPKWFSPQTIMVPLNPDWPAGGPFLTMLMLAVLGGVAFLGLTLVRLRAEAHRPASRQPLKPVTGPRRSPVDEEAPIQWREQVLASGWLRWLQAAALAVATPVAAAWLTDSGNPWSLLPLWLIGGLVICLFVGVRASGAISGERSRQTWESLLLTPLDSWEILLDKRRGLIRANWPMFATFSVPALFYSATLEWPAVLLGLGLWSLLGEWSPTLRRSGCCVRPCPVVRACRWWLRF